MAVSVNMKHSAAYDVRNDRKTRWGNPFVLGRHGSREAVIAQYEGYLRQQIRCGAVTAEDLAALDGKRLGCWCAPLACHGDVLAAYARRAKAYLDRGS